MLHHHTRQIHHGERGMLIGLELLSWTSRYRPTKAIVSFKVPDNSSGKQSPYRSFEEEPIDRCNSHSRYTSHLVLTLDTTHPPKLSPSTMLETLQSTLNHYSPLLTQSIIECIYHYFISLNPGDYLNYKKEPKENNLRQNTLALYCLHEITMFHISFYFWKSVNRFDKVKHNVFTLKFLITSSKTKKEIKNCSETNECNLAEQVTQALMNPLKLRKHDQSH
ncbi:LOW QUALITY PROTEIN: hypothetical protein HID58_094919 [Brassica napus]|uniref:Uncharacterized protein n=1 Tax=Brassica napus TaxID=3708 RepID=A0ABQ7X5Q5_BRANA|nr:LOW QUALITY PROTEIN: hypothetical protein HID58_094919 [Brassica napus]